jgi:RNA polymerase sigma factor (sigma-70 family)
LDSIALIFRHLRPFRGGDTSAVSDGELLRRFQASGDEAAFELLVWRHGPMVLGVCRRVLRDTHAAEDAFQATFLTLARRAGSIGRREAVAGWLYTVAHRVALAARARRARLAALEGAALAGAAEPVYLPTDEPAGCEARELLRAEVDRLPDAFRAVVVLCCLEGRTRAEAAEQLGVPPGTVESRLARARERLRLSLAARGLALAAAPFVAFLGDHLGDLIKVSPVLVHATVHLVLLFKMGTLAAAGTAAELMEEVSRAPSRALRWTAATAALTAAILASGAALLPAQVPPPPAPAVPPPGAPPVVSAPPPETGTVPVPDEPGPCHSAP